MSPLFSKWISIIINGVAFNYKMGFPKDISATQVDEYSYTDIIIKSIKEYAMEKTNVHIPMCGIVKIKGAEKQFDVLFPLAPYAADAGFYRIAARLDLIAQNLPEGSETKETLMKLMKPFQMHYE